MNTNFDNNNRYNTIIIDGNNVYEKNYNALKQLTCEIGLDKEFITGGIYGFIKSLNKIQKNYLSFNKESKIYIVFDNALSKINMRRELDQSYKANRRKKSTPFIRGLEILQQIILNYSDNIILVYRSEYEADDLVKPLVLSIVSEYDNVLLVSDDLDWARMIGHSKRHIDWLNSHYNSESKIVNKESFKEKYGFMPSESNITLWKTFRGDQSDNIPVGVSGIRKEILYKLMDDCTDIFDVFLKLGELIYLGEWKQKIIQSEQRLKTNHQLVSFIGIGKEEITEFLYTCSFRPNNLRILYESLGFKKLESLDNRLVEYLNGKKESLFDNSGNSSKTDSSQSKIHQQDSFFKQPELKRI